MVTFVTTTSAVYGVQKRAKSEFCRSILPPTTQCDGGMRSTKCRPVWTCDTAWRAARTRTRTDLNGVGRGRSARASIDAAWIVTEGYGDIRRLGGTGTLSASTIPWRHTRFGRIERATQRRRAITRQIVEIPRRKIGISAAAQRARQGLVYDKAAAAAAATARPSVALVALGDCARPARQRHGHG